MANGIYADSERIKMLAQILENKANDLQTYQAAAYNAASGIGDYFTGTALGGTFAAARNAIKKNHTAMYEAVKSYAVALVNTAITYQNADAALGRAMLALTGGATVILPNGDKITVDNPSGHPLISNDLDYYKKKFWGNRYNCKEFARSVIADAFGVNIPSTGKPDYTLAGATAISGGQLAYGRDAITSDSIRQMFGGAQNGDVVQMHWDWSVPPKTGTNTVHTAVFLGVDQNGMVQFLEANNPSGEIRINTYTCEKLAGLYNHGGCGASIYRFG